MKLRFLTCCVSLFVFFLAMSGNESAIKKLDNVGAAHYRSMVSGSGRAYGTAKLREVCDDEHPQFLPLILKLKEGADALAGGASRHDARRR